MQHAFVLGALAGAAVIVAACGPSAQPAPTTAPSSGAASSAAAPSPVVAPSPAAALSPAPVPSAAQFSPPGAVASPSGVAAVPSSPPAQSPVVPSPSALGAVAVAPSPSAGAAAATPSAASVTVWVANTDGGGVYLRNSPHIGDRSSVLADGTALSVTGVEVEGDGQRWYPVRLADGTEGFVQVYYTTQTEPTGPPPTPSGAPPN